MPWSQAEGGMGCCIGVLKHLKILRSFESIEGSWICSSSTGLSPEWFQLLDAFVQSRIAHRSLHIRSPCFSPHLDGEAGRLLEDEGFGNAGGYDLSGAAGSETTCV